MAKALRRKASSTLVWILMGLLVVGLAGFGTARFTGGAQSVASVGDREVSANEYARALNQALVNLERQSGQRLTLQQARMFGVSQQVLGELMISAALDNETDSIGFSAGDERLARIVGELPGFVGIDGNFNSVVYRSTLDRAGLTVAEFEAQLRDELARKVLESAVTGGIDAPRAATRAFLGYLATKRDVSFVVLDEGDLTTPVAPPDDSQLRGYHSANADQFFVPETKVMTYAWLTPDMLVDGITVDDNVLRAAYEARSDEFIRPERRLVERLVFGDQAQAEAAAARIEAGEIDFPGLVAERGLDLGDIDLGDATKAQLGTAGDAVFALTETGVSGVITSDIGPAIFRLNAILYAQTTPFDEARERLHDAYALDEARRQIADISGEADDLLAGGATIEDLTDETALVLGQIDYAPGSIADIAAFGNFHTVAGQVAPDDFPQVEALDDGGIFALRLDVVRDQRPQSFDEARAGVEAAWRAGAVAAALTAQAESLASDIGAGTPVAEFGLSFSATTGLTRQAALPELPAAALAAIFEMAPGEIRVLGEGGQVALIRLDAVTAPDITDEATAAQLQEIQRQLARGIAQDIFQLYSIALQIKAGITLNQAMIEAVHTQFN